MIIFFLLAIVLGKKAVITETTTIDDVREFTECKNIDIDAINNLLDPYACRGFRAICLRQFKLTDLNGQCKEHLECTQLAHISPKRFHDMINTDDPMKAACLPQVFRFFYTDIRNMNGYKYVKYCVRDTHWTAIVADQLKSSYEEDSKVLAAMLKPELIPLIDPLFFNQIAPLYYKRMKPEVFKYMTGDQFHTINTRMISVTQIRMVTPENFQWFPFRILIQAMPQLELNSISPEQAANFGQDPKEVLCISDEKRLKNAIYGHPCVALKDVIGRFRSIQMQDIIKQRCKPIWDHPICPARSIRNYGHRRALL